MPLAHLARWSDQLRRSAYAFPLAVVVAALMVGISELSYNEASTQLSRLVVMGRIRLELARVVRRVTDAESGQRGYLLTGRADYLAPFRDANLDVMQALAALEEHYRVLQDTQHRALLDKLSSGVRTKLSELNEVLSLQDAGRTRAALDLMLTGIGRDQMDDLRQTAEQLLNAENARVATGLNSVFDTLSLNRVGVSAMTAISLLVLGMYLRQQRQHALLAAEQQQLIENERDRLEHEVRVRTQELTELARHLETAREDERARLARDLHDELGALLTAAKLDVARIRPKLQLAAPDLLPRMGHLVETLNSGIALKRRIIEDLRPSTLNNLGLLAALEILCAEFAQRLEVPVLTRLQPVALPPSAELTVFRLVQESLNNIAKHAGASRIEVNLGVVDGQAQIEVVDNGAGFDPAQVGLARHGLLGMRYRVEAEQGQLSVTSGLGTGTRLLARLPQDAALLAAATERVAGAEPGGPAA